MLPARWLIGLVAVVVVTASPIGRVKLGRQEPFNYQRAGWQQMSRASPNEKLTLLFAIKQENVQLLEQAFWELSDPSSEKYGQWLSLADVKSLIAPSPESFKVVQQFILTSFPQSRVSYMETGDFIKVETFVSEAESALGPDAEFYEFEHKHRDLVTRVTRSHQGYSVPQEVANALDFVHGVTDFHRKFSHQRIRPTSSSIWRQDDSGRVTRKPQPTTAYPPELVEVIGGDFEVILPVLPMCLSGAPCASMSDLASDIKAINITLTDKNMQATSYIFDQLQDNCKLSSEIEAVGCAFTIATAENFVVYVVNASTHFTDGTISPSTQARASIAAQPWAIPSTLKSLYNIAQDTAATNPRSYAGVALWQGEYASLSELQQFLQMTGEPPSHSNVTAPTQPNNSSQPGGEGQMDIELISAMGRGVDTTFWYSSDAATGLLEWAMQVSNTSSPPLVWSCSWGVSEYEIDGMLGENFMSRVTIELQKMGVRGLTLVFASGDAGATGIGRGQDKCIEFQPDFPSSSPYVLSVSATMFAAGTPHPSLDEPVCTQTLYNQSIQCNTWTDVTETAVACCGSGVMWTTGGGFSANFSRPKYQESAVQAYFSHEKSAGQLPPPQYWNSTGNAYPDISAIGNDVLIWRNQGLEDTGGTSASSPIAAGIISLLNDLRLNSNQPPFGPIASWLYSKSVSHPSAFNDVTTGSNACGEMQCCPYGFFASPGYDPVTGLGSLNFEELKQIVVSESV